jgi:hypothetical protein
MGSGIEMYHLMIWERRMGLQEEIREATGREMTHFLSPLRTILSNRFHVPSRDTSRLHTGLLTCRGMRANYQRKEGECTEDMRHFSD